MSNITIRPMEPEDWDAVSEIYSEGIATEHATFQTTCPPYTAWDAFHIKECRLVILDGGELAGWAALRRVDPRWCYRGVAEVSIYVGEKFRGRGLGSRLLTALCEESEKGLLDLTLHRFAGQHRQPRPPHEVRLPGGRAAGAHRPGLSWPLAGHLPDGAPHQSRRACGV